MTNGAKAIIPCIDERPLEIKAWSGTLKRSGWSAKIRIQGTLSFRGTLFKWADALSPVLQVQFAPTAKDKSWVLSSKLICTGNQVVRRASTEIYSHSPVMDTKTWPQVLQLQKRRPLFEKLALHFNMMLNATMRNVCKSESLFLSSCWDRYMLILFQCNTVWAL